MYLYKHFLFQKHGSIIFYELRFFFEILSKHKQPHILDTLTKTKLSLKKAKPKNHLLYIFWGWAKTILGWAPLTLATLHPMLITIEQNIIKYSKK